LIERSGENSGGKMKPEDEGKGNAALLHKSKTRRTIKMIKR